MKNILYNLIISFINKFIFLQIFGFIIISSFIGIPFIRKRLLAFLKAFNFVTIYQIKNLSWSERNFQFQNFLKDHLQEFPEINPSFILYNPLMHKIAYEPVSKPLRSFITETALANVENTQIVLAKTIVAGGKTCRENYLKHPYKSPIIVNLIKELLNNNFEL